MHDHRYSAEADYCRNLAAEFVGRAERPTILGIAEAFEDLAQRDLLPIIASASVRTRSTSV